jgi:hypothetical protein
MTTLGRRWFAASTSTSSTTSSPASSSRSSLHLLIYSDNRGLHRHPLSLPLCTLQPSWRPSRLVSSPTWREVVSTGPILCTPGTGNTGACLRPRRIPESGKLGRSASSPCSSSRTRFWQNRSMPSSPTCAWFWQSHGRTSSSTAWTASTLASLFSMTASTCRRPSTVLYASAA